jgi:hypothetical protein
LPASGDKTHPSFPSGHFILPDTNVFLSQVSKAQGDLQIELSWVALSRWTLLNPHFSILPSSCFKLCLRKSGIAHCLCTIASRPWPKWMTRRSVCFTMNLDRKLLSSSLSYWLIPGFQRDSRHSGRRGNSQWQEWSRCHCLILLWRNVVKWKQAYERPQHGITHTSP